MYDRITFHFFTGLLPINCNKSEVENTDIFTIISEGTYSPVPSIYHMHILQRMERWVGHGLGMKPVGTNQVGYDS